MIDRYVDGWVDGQVDEWVRTHMDFSQDVGLVVMLPETTASL